MDNGHEFSVHYRPTSCLSFFNLSAAASGIYLMVVLYAVVAGSLGTSVFDTDVYLVGASGGVYALLAAHLANVLLVTTH